MTDCPPLDLDGDDQRLLAQVVGYYHATLNRSDEARDYLRRRGVAEGAVGHFRVGYSDRSLGVHLPSNRVVAGRKVRDRLGRLGLFRSSGHEHFRGSVTVPILAADGTGRIVDVYGRKVRDDLRPGTATHLNLNDRREGVLNVAAFAGVDEVVLCGSVWDALTLWSHGYRNATAMFGPDALTGDLLAAFREFGIARVLTPCEPVTDRLLAAGLEVFHLRLPLALDINALACRSGDPADALGSLLRAAEWVGKGKPGVVVPDALAEHLAADDDEDDLDADDEPTRSPDPRPDPVVRLASPMPPVPVEDEAEVNDDEVTVTFGTRRYRVRGLGNNNSLEVLRVNVLASNGVGLFVDTLDLYSAKHRHSFVRQAAEEMGVEEATVKRDVGRLLLTLERVQDGRLAAATTPRHSDVDMTPADRAAALALLRSPDLLDRVVADCRVVGERNNVLVAYLAAVSRLLDQPLAVIVQSTSAAGKTTLLDGVLSMLPPEAVVRYSAMTGQSLYYMADGTLRHKVLAIAEEGGAARASYALKLLQSEGELRIASTAKDAGTGRLTTQEYRVEGPVALCLTTTSIAVDEELLNRCLVLTVDEDRDQTRAIHRLQRHRQTLAGQLAARDRDATLKLHQDAQRLLRAVLVVNPFAERLTYMDARTTTRRDQQKYLTLIRSIALARQHQRPTRTATHQGQPVEYIEVTLEDVALANELAADVLGRGLDELPPQTRRLLAVIEDMVTTCCQRDGIDRADFRFTRRQLRDHAGWGDTQLKIHLRRLVDLEYLAAHRDRDSRRHLYELVAGGTADGRVLPGLVDVEELRRAEWADEGEDRSARAEDRSGVGRGKVGPRSG